MLSGSLEADKIFVPGDLAQVVVSYEGDTVLTVTMTDHFRLWQEGALALLFAVFLFAFAGIAGLRAILSFVITVLMLWKILVPCYLNGWNPVLTGLLLVLVLTAVIILLVYGWELQNHCGSIGSFSGYFNNRSDGCHIYQCLSDSRRSHALFRIAAVQRIPILKFNSDFHGQYLYRRIGGSDGFGCGYYLCRL